MFVHPQWTYSSVTCARAKQGAHVPRDLRGTFAGVQHLTRLNCRQQLIDAGNFNEHSVYTLYSETDITTGRVTVVISSENLLLNAYRQSVCGLPSQLCLDASHRIVLGTMFIQPTYIY